MAKQTESRPSPRALSGLAGLFKTTYRLGGQRQTRNVRLDGKGRGDPLEQIREVLATEHRRQPGQVELLAVAPLNIPGAETWRPSEKPPSVPPSGEQKAPEGGAENSSTTSGTTGTAATSDAGTGAPSPTPPQTPPSK